MKAGIPGCGPIPRTYNEACDFPWQTQRPGKRRPLRNGDSKPQTNLSELSNERGRHG